MEIWLLSSCLIQVLLENKHLHNGRHFVLIASFSPSALLIKYAINPLAEDPLKYTSISKNVVGDNDECQLSKGDCTTEKKCGYWILIGNNLPWCRLHTVSTFDGESYGLSIFFRIQWSRLHFSYAFVKGEWNAKFLNFWWMVMLSRG